MRITTSVSTAITTPAQFSDNRCIHLGDGARRTGRPETTRDILQSTIGDGFHGAKQNTFARGFNRKFRARLPVLLVAHRLRQDDLTV
jgi:hypothetical protein